MSRIQFYQGGIKIRKDRFPPIRSMAYTFRDSVENAVDLDAKGVPFISGTAEQHGNYDGWSPFSLGALAGLALKTKHLRLQPTALPLPQQDPLRVAGDLAMLDVLSGGRAEGGFGYGYCPRHFAVTGTQRTGRAGKLMEGMEVIRLALSQEEFSYAGKHFKYDRIRLLPRPIQKPHPPLWLLGGTSPLGARRAGKHGFPFLAYGMNFEELKVAMEVYYEAAEEADVDKSQLEFGNGELGIWVGRTHDEARTYMQAFMSGHEWETYMSYGWLIDDREKGRGPSYASAEYKPGMKLSAPAQRWVDNQILCTPDEAIEHVQKLIDMGITRMFAPWGNREVVMKEVLPHFLPELNDA